MINYLVRVKDALYVDGSLRDIYVLETDMPDWQKLLDFLRTSVYPLEFFVAGKPHTLPDQIEEAFALVHHDGGKLIIDKNHLDLHCYFYTDKEIELDLDPRTMDSEQQIVRLLHFLREVSRLLHKAVILTPENASYAPLLRLQSETDEFFSA